MSISIIIPVYNGEKYINECYSNLITQTSRQWEAIFINDGSTDNSQYILEKIANQDSRVKIISKQNEGVAKARKIGIIKASFDIITFLDVDDRLLPNAIEQYLGEFNNQNIDVVISGFNIITEENRKCNIVKYPYQNISGEEAINSICTGNIRWQLWAKAYRKALFEDIVTPYGIRSAEDLVVCIQLIAKANRVKVLNAISYDYIQVSSSVTHSKAVEISFDALKAINLLTNIDNLKLSKLNQDCLFMLIVSTALKVGATDKEKIFRKTLIAHFSFRSLMRLNFFKGVTLLFYRFLNLNLLKLL